MRRASLIFILALASFSASEANRSAGDEPTETVYRVHTRKFRIPFAIDAEEESDIDKLILHVSRDEGKTWRPAGEAAPRKSFFDFKASEDGSYWFTTQAILKDGTKDPEDEEDFEPDCKVLVDLRAEKTREVIIDLKPEGPEPASKATIDNLKREVEALKKEVEELRQRLKRLEGEPKKSPG